MVVKLVEREAKFFAYVPMFHNFYFYGTLRSPAPFEASRMSASAMLRCSTGVRMVCACQKGKSGLRAYPLRCVPFGTGASVGRCIVNDEGFWILFQKLLVFQETDETDDRFLPLPSDSLVSSDS